MLIVEIEGGLGSQMFAYAAARRLAIRHNVELFIDTRNYRTYKKFSPELHHFALDATFLSHDEADRICGPQNERIQVVAPRHLHFDPSILEIDDPDVLMRGNYVSEDYFFDVTDTLRKELSRVTAPTSYAQDLATEMTRIRKAGFQPVSVHVRRGDYAKDAEINAIYGLCTREYYQNAMALVARMVERPWFIFFSNDSDWIEKEFPGEFRTITRFPADAPPVDDMLSMASCDHHILANSGFSWWGAWLGERDGQVVVVPRPWLRDRSINTEDIPKRNWIGLGAIESPQPTTVPIDIPIDQQQSASDVLLIGAGVEDARTPAWGHVVRSLESSGFEVSCFDPAEAERLGVGKSPAQQFRWMLAARRPTVVLSIAGDDPLSQELLEIARTKDCRVVELHVDGLSTGESTEVTLAGCISEVPEFLHEGVARQFPPCDVLLVGAPTPAGQKLAETLVATGVDCRLLGDGWSDVASLRARSNGDVLHTHVSSVLQQSKIVVLLPESDGQPPGRSVYSAFNGALAQRPIVAIDNARLATYLTEDLDYFACDSKTAPQAIQHLLQNRAKCESLTVNALAKIKTHSWNDKWTSLLSNVPRTRVRVTKEGPTVTVVTAAYNTREFIGATIESILGQTESDFELLIMNDGSRDGSASVIEKYLGDPRVRLISQPNIGQSGRFDFIWNGLMPLARGKYLAPIGGDDIALPARLERQLATFHEDSTVDLVHTAGVAINDQGDFTHRVFELDFSYDTSSQLRRLVKGNNVAMPTVMMKRELLDSVGMWSGGFAADYRQWLQLARFGVFRYLPEPLTAYRVHEKSASTSTAGGHSNDSMIQGILTRLKARSELSITDLYPALQEVPETDRDAWAAAYVDLGNGHLAYLATPQAALAEYEVALELAPHQRSVIELCMAAACQLDGDFVAADRMLRRSVAADPSLLMYTENGEGLRVSQLVSPGAISNSPFVLSTSVASKTICWDGTPASQRRILVVPDWNRPDRIAATVQTFSHMFPASMNVDLVIPTAGISVGDAMNVLQSALQGIDLSQCAPINLELWDDLSYLPLDRFASVVNMLDPGFPSTFSDNMQQVFDSMVDPQAAHLVGQT